MVHGNVLIVKLVFLKNSRIMDSRINTYASSSSVNSRIRAVAVSMGLQYGIKFNLRQYTRNSKIIFARAAEQTLVIVIMMLAYLGSADSSLFTSIPQGRFKVLHGHVKEKLKFKGQQTHNYYVIIPR